MSGQPAVSARTLVRGSVLVIGYFVLISGMSCGHETFDLLQTDGIAGVGAADAGTANSGAQGGAAGSRSSEHDAGLPRAGAGGVNGGGGSGSAGFSGFPQGGNDQPCLAGEVCTDGGATCPPDVASCKRCASPADCGRDAPPFCDPDNGRCVECRLHENDCPAGETCDSYFLRCAKACSSTKDCENHTICNTSRGLCVECERSSDCLATTPQQMDTCFAGFCVECIDNTDCANTNPPRPLCVGLHCVPRP
jgi:hypothetical protein